jgi:hypothetical protein
MTNLSFLEQGHSTARTPAAVSEQERRSRAVQRVRAARRVRSDLDGDDRAEVLAALGLTQAAQVLDEHEPVEVTR